MYFFSPVSVPWERLPFEYPGAVKWNAETLLVHPQTGDVYVVNKLPAGNASTVFKFPQPLTPGVKATLAETYERIHRSNLVGMGILPLQFEEGQSCKTLGLTGLETYTIQGISTGLQPRQRLTVKATDPKGEVKSFTVISRIDTPNEVDYYKHDGILQFVLRSLLK